MGSTEPGRVTIELTESVGSVGWFREVSCKARDEKLCTWTGDS